MTAALLRWWTVPRLNSHSNPSSTGESSTAKKTTPKLVCLWHGMAWHGMALREEVPSSGHCGETPDSFALNSIAPQFP